MIVSDDRIELRHSRGIRIDRWIIADCFIDEIAWPVTIGIGYVIGVFRGDIRPYKIIDQLMRFLWIGRVLWNCQIIEPQLRTLFRNRIADVDTALRLRRTLLRLLDVAGKANDQTDLPGCEGVEIFR